MVFTEKGSRTASAKPVPRGAPQPVHAEKGRITVSFAFEFDDYFKYKLVYVVATAFLLAVTFFMFSRADFKMTDLFDFNRLQYTLEKLYSISAILYVVLFSLSLAVATYYGFKLKKWQALVVLPVALLVAFLFSYVYPQFYMPFIAMAITVSAAAFFASFAKEVNGTYATETLSRALLVFIVLAFIFTYSMVESQKETRFNQFFQGVTELALKQVSSQAAPSMAASLVVPEFNASELVQAALDRNQTRAFVAQQYNARRDAFLEPFEGRSYFADIASSVRTFEELPASEQEEVVDSFYAFLANQSQGFEDVVRQSILSRVSVSNASTASAQPTELTPFQVERLKRDALQVPAVKAVYDNFSLVVALLVVFVVASFNFFTKIIAGLVTLLLIKLQL